MAFTHEQIRGIVDTHRGKAATERQRWDQWRRWYIGEYWRKDFDAPTGAWAAETGAGDDTINFETNYPYAYIDTMVANVCPTNPKVTVTARRHKNAESARYREALINDVFFRQKLHAALWEMAINTSICGRSFVKTVWNFVRATVEYKVVDPRYIFFDMSASKWEDIRYLIEVTVLPKQEFETRVKKSGRKGGFYSSKVAKDATFGGYPSWLRDMSANKSMVNGASRDVFHWVTVYEFYDFVNKKYYHLLDGIEDPLFEGDLPYRYVPNPFEILSFNSNMKDLAGLSDIALISSLQERLNELDTLELWHAQTSIPITLVQGSLVDNPEMIKTAIRDASTPGSVVDVQGKADVPIRDLFSSTPTPTLIPSFDKMRARSQQVIEFVLGIPQYSRGVVGVTDVATEVALADSATRTRNGRRIKAVNDIVSTLGHNTVGLYEEFLSAESALPIRLTDSRESLEVTRRALTPEGVTPGSDHPLDYDYDSVPYSPAENNRLTQLRNIQTFLPILAEATVVDKEKLIIKLVDLLQMRDVLLTPDELEKQKAAEQAQAQPQPGPTPPGGMAKPIQGTPNEDTISTGGMPPGVEPPPMALPEGGAGVTLPNALRGQYSGF
tara:strand:- start:3700 stop:5532 length:1833 start_codon:yes stop_codon:yes gene_type:complete